MVAGGWWQCWFCSGAMGGIHGAPYVAGDPENPGINDVEGVRLTDKQHGRELKVAIPAPLPYTMFQKRSTTGPLPKRQQRTFILG